MPVPASINDLSTTAASNYPQGSEPALPLMDDYMRAFASFIAWLRDNKLNSSAVSSFIMTLLDDADAATARGTLGAVGLSGAETIAGVKTFSSSPVVPTPSGASEAANKSYVDTDASTSVKGRVQLATSAEAAALSNTQKAITPSTLSGAFQSSNQSLASSGYQKLPGGLIVQWGTVAGTGADVSVTFPIAFPTAAFVVLPVMVGTPPGNVALSCTVDQIAAANFTARPRFAAAGSSGVASQGFVWVALGY